MSQSHLVIDFPIKDPADAKALAEELPPLMPDFAKVQDDLGTVHFSRFMIEGDEKLLFLSDIDDEVDEHIERLVEHAGPLLDCHLRTRGPPSGHARSRRPAEGRQMAEASRPRPLDTYFAYEDASVQDIKAAALAAGFTGNTSQSPLLTYWTFKSRLQAFAMKLVAKVHGRERKVTKGRMRSGRCTSRIWCRSRTTTSASSPSSTATWRSTSRTSPTRPRSSSIPLFPHVDGAPPTPVAKNAQAFYQWALENNQPPIGFYSAYPGLSVLDIRALLADRKSPADAAG